MKRLFVVTDTPRYKEENSCYCYIVKAKDYKDAIEIVRHKTGHDNWNWDVVLADNEEIWQ